MDGMNRLVLVLFGQRLRLLDGFLRLLSELVESNHNLTARAGHETRPSSIIPRAYAWGCTFPRAYAWVVIFTWRGLAASFFGSFTVSTPFLYSAATFSGSTVAGTVKLRTK